MLKTYQNNSPPSPRLPRKYNSWFLVITLTKRSKIYPRNSGYLFWGLNTSIYDGARVVSYRTFYERVDFLFHFFKKYLTFLNVMMISCFIFCTKKTKKGTKNHPPVNITFGTKRSSPPFIYNRIETLKKIPGISGVIL